MVEVIQVLDRIDNDIVSIIRVSIGEWPEGNLISLANFVNLMIIMVVMR